MQKIQLKVYLLPIISLFLIMNLPLHWVEGARGNTIALLTPFWEWMNEIKHYFPGQKEFNPSENFKQLEIENHLLKEKIAHLQQLFLHEQDLLRKLAAAPKQIRQQDQIQEKIPRHLALLSEELSLQLEAIPASVIYRPPINWNSFFWINQGEEANTKLKRTVIAKNSPVCSGTSLVGVVDYVGKRQSRVRLITDATLVPAVRVARGGQQQKVFLKQILQKLEQLLQSGNVDEEISEIKKTLTRLYKAKMKNDDPKTLYLAKGEIHGGSKPLWRRQGAVLKGIGFNYDFGDEEGPARDLRTGTTNSHSKANLSSLVQKKDVLVTTGFDGVFPVGLDVAEVVHVSPLQEGDYYYELEARPTAEAIQELSVVFVIPPLGYESSTEDK